MLNKISAIIGKFLCSQGIHKKYVSFKHDCMIEYRCERPDCKYEYNTGLCDECKLEEIVWENCADKMPPKSTSRIIYHYLKSDEYFINEGNFAHFFTGLENFKAFTDKLNWTEYTKEKSDVVLKIMHNK